jgi:16S rRNA C1402 (ribose-2'-O) methylase RsmI
MVVIVEGSLENKEEIDINKLIDEAKEMSNKGMSNKEIVALLVDKYGLKKNFLYDLVCKNV